MHPHAARRCSSTTSQLHPLTARDRRPAVARAASAAIAVFPVQWRGRVARRDPAPQAQRRASHHIGPRGLELGKLIASITAAHLRHGAVLESLRDQTHRISRARYEAERRLRGIDSLKEHFEAGADGVVVLDDAGPHPVRQPRRRADHRLRARRPARQRARRPRSPTRAARADRRHRRRACSPASTSTRSTSQLSTTSGAPVWVSVSTSTVLAGTGAVILAFRDVTAERALEHELRSTKEFLERLIDSTVDAIIAADMRGQIILFNQGAERLFGYRAREVIGKLPGVGALRGGRRPPDHAHAALDVVRRRRPPRADAPRGPHRERRDRPGQHDRVDRLRGRSRGRHRRHPHRPPRAHPHGAAPPRRPAEAAALREAGARRRARRRRRARAQPAADLDHGLRAADRAPERRRTRAHLRAVERDPLARPSAWPASSRRSARITKYETTDYVGSARMLDLDRATAPAAAVDDPAIPVADRRSRPASSSSRRVQHRRGRTTPAELDDAPPTAPDGARRRRSTAPTSTTAGESPTGPPQRAMTRELATADAAAAQLDRAARSSRPSCRPSSTEARARRARARRARPRCSPAARCASASSTSARASRRAPTSAARRCATASRRGRHDHARPRSPRARLKSAVAASARLLVRERWDSPFTGMAAGFAVPLAAAGELYGVLDVGYPPGADARAGDEPLVLPLATTSRSRCAPCASRTTRSACATTRRACSSTRTR